MGAMADSPNNSNLSIFRLVNVAETLKYMYTNLVEIAVRKYTETKDPLKKALLCEVFSTEPLEKFYIRCPLMRVF